MLYLLEKPVRLLFVGSSSVYFNDMPDAIAQAVQGAIHERENRPVEAFLVGRSGSDIRVYLEPGFQDYQYGVKPGQTFLEKVRDEPFDFVILQGVSRFIIGEHGEAHAEAISVYCDAIREAGAEPVLYEMGWGKDMQTEAGIARLRTLALQKQIRHYIPCASAWQRVYRERPTLLLQHPKDPVHPGDLGHFLNVACFYCALTHTTPLGVLPRTFPVWTHWDKQEKEAWHEAIAQKLSQFHPTVYQNQLPEWMWEAPAFGLTCTLDTETATYLETVAWETWCNTYREIGIGKSE
jgi:hypothetical protein